MDNPIVAQRLAPIESAVFVDPWNAEQIEGILDLCGLSGLLCEDCEHNVVGYVIVKHWDPVLHVLRMAVHPNWHRKGVGRELLQALQRDAERDGLVGIDILVHERNVTGQLFLKAVGSGRETAGVGLWHGRLRSFPACKARTGGGERPAVRRRMARRAAAPCVTGSYPAFWWHVEKPTPSCDDSQNTRVHNGYAGVRDLVERWRLNRRSKREQED